MLWSVVKSRIKTRSLVLYNNVLAKFDNRVVEVFPRVYDVSYRIDSKTYKFRVRKSLTRKRKNDVVQIYGDNDENLTHAIVPYFGHSEDFNGVSYTPSDFGQTRLTFLMIDGEDMTFERDDILETSRP